MHSSNYNRVVKLNRSEIKIFHKTDSNPTYGELKKSGFIQLTSYLPNNLKSFCDLGSGIGVVVKYFADLTKHFTTIHGVELSEEPYHISLNLI